MYSSKKIDDMVSGVVMDYFGRIKEILKDRTLEIRYKKEVEENKKIKKVLLQKKPQVK